ncbi:hypothetical protein ACI1UE_08155 [Lactococcus petauri]|uniref:hypothetical protein n=1 Tax=Lactococcus petauri TaxID=1940789 RepID=UPI003855475E
MSIKITFSNNETIIIEEDTLVSAWKSLDKYSEEGQNEGYYVEQVCYGSQNSSIELGTNEQWIGLAGLFGNSDWFAIAPDYMPVYNTSSIVSIEEV